MAWFRCFIRGENFPGELTGDAGLFGFYTTRFVEATSGDEAETLALQGLKAEPKLAPPAGYKPTGIARVFFEEIDEVAAEEVPAQQQQGLVWYPMEEEA